MSLFEIKSWFNGRVLFSLECGSMKLCLEAAVRSSADLTSADLRSASLTSASLRFANLTSADLRFANFTSADLTSANLTSADLTSASLRFANLTSAKWPREAVVLRPPTQIWGLFWPVTIFGSHMQIGCEVHSMREWESFDDERILRMGNREAAGFWAANKTRLLAFRDTGAEEAFAAQQAAVAEKPAEASA